MDGHRRSRSSRILGSALGLLVACLVLASSADAVTLPTGFAERTVFSGLQAPTAVRFAADGRVFVAQKNGLIMEYSSVTDTTGHVYADLRRQVDDYWDRGLLSIALDPSFPTVQTIYALYTHDAPIGGTAPVWNDACGDPTGQGCVVSGRLSRILADGSEQVLIEDWCQQYPSHSVGSLAFGPDGNLYVSAGDGASFTFLDWGQGGIPANVCGDPPGGTTMTPPGAEGGALRAQDVRTAGDPAGLDGAILRVDRNGNGVAGNPFASSPDPNARRILAYGLRNPFRMAFRPGSNELWVGDVGFDTWEEIDRITDVTDGNARNFGWPCYEGQARQPGYDGVDVALCENLYAQGSGAVTTPFFQYRHSGAVVTGDGCPIGGSSISGLTFQFYGGGPYPPEYDGALLFADYSRNCIWAVLRGSGSTPSPSLIRPFAVGAAAPVDLQIGPDGNVYYADLTGGTVRRIEYVGTAANQPPVARVSATPTSGEAPLTVSFDASASTDADGDPLSYTWDLDGDGVFGDATTATASRTYTTPGNRNVKVRVGDGRGGTDTATVSIGVGRPAPVIASPNASSTWKVGDTITFNGSATDSRGQAIPASRLSWTLTLHHGACPACHDHQLETFPGVASGSFTAPDHGYPSDLELTLQATDADGLVGTTSVRLLPQTTTLTLGSAPSGAQLTINGDAVTAPATRTVIVGSSNSLGAPSPQTIAGTDHLFSAWSDGGDATHTVTATAVPRTLTATFTPGAAEDKALGKVATASSTAAAGYEPAKAVDGNSGTRWSSTWTDNQWWRVDLGRARQVDTVRTNWEAAYPSSYRIETSLDGAAWTTAADVTLGAAGVRSTGFAARSARYVRITGLTRATPYGISLWDVSVYGPVDSGSPPPPPPPTEDKALGRPATASSTYAAGYEPGRATDGSSGTRWSSTFTDNQWWQVDLGAARQVDTITVNWEGAYASSYRIATSTDGTTFTTAADVTTSGPGDKTTTFTARAARYVRITGLARGTPYGISMWDVEVYGPADSGTPPVPAEDKALNRTTTASSTFAAGYEPALAVDGRSTTRWSSAFTDDQWWQVDLGTARQVDTVKVTWEGAYASSYRISTSTNGVAFTTAATVSIGAPVVQTTTFSVRAARYVRITGVTRATPYGISFWDVNVLGPADST